MSPVAALLACVHLGVTAPGGRAVPSAAKAPADRDLPAAEEPTDEDPYAERAPLDVTTLLTDTSKAYLQARGRLAAHPALATSAILDRLAAIPAPTQSDRKRLLDVLSEVAGPEHVEMFAQELRRAVLGSNKPQGPSHAGNGAGEALARWLPLLVAQGPAARAPLAQLIGDQALSLAVRAALLDAMVTVSDRAGLGELVVLVGRGDISLRAQLTRSLQLRVAADPDDRVALLAAVDAAATKAKGPRLASLIQFRGAVSDPDDASFTQRLAALTSDPNAGFEVHVAAARGLSRSESAAADAALRALARRSLQAKAGQAQRGEILAWIALRGLPSAQARPLATEFRLTEHPSPRLATLGFRLAPLPADHAWLEASQKNPWPSVRQAALSRVAAPCAKPTIKRLARWARPKARNGEKDPAVARSNVAALGRCGPDGFNALVSLLNAGAVDIEQRTEAARQLSKHGGAAGADAVATALDRDPPRRLARRLAQALRFSPKPTQKAMSVLCEAAAAGDEVAAAAHRTLAALHDDPAAACAQ